MNNIPKTVFTLFFAMTFIAGQAQKTYQLIVKKTGKLNLPVIQNLPPNLRAMAAFYSAMGGTGCIDLTCGLTTALGLGNQGSDAQKSLIEKYFPNDHAATLVISQDCYLPPSSASTFSNFVTLDFIVNGESIQVNYQLNVYEHGQLKIIRGPDVYTYKNHVFKNSRRVLYAWTSK
jgi:hypothetical protein